MAEPIGVAAGLLAFATFAFQSSIALYKTIQSFQNHPKTVRALEEELGELSRVLGSLTETISAATDIDLSALEFPLRRCGNACKEFEQEIIKCSSRSGGSRTSFRDWAKLRYLGDNIDAFSQQLAGYKSTIIIALTDANLRKSSVTAESLEGYKDLIKTATDDLESHLQSIDEKLEKIFGNTVTESSSDATELRLMKEERISTQNGNSPGLDELDALPERITNEGLQECRNSLNRAAEKLEGYMTDLIDRMVRKSTTSMTSEEEIADLAKLRDEWETARQCRDICSKADTHLKDNVSNIENHAYGDAVQFMISTDGKTLHGRNRGFGWRTRQVGGHVSDLTVQQMSRDMSSIRFQNVGSEEPASQGKASTISDDRVDTGHGSEFGERHGRGFKLPPKTTPGTPPSSKGVSEG